MIKIIGELGRERMLYDIGEIDGITVGSALPARGTEKDSLLSLSRLYINAYTEHFDRPPPCVFDASYAITNLPHIHNEYNETGSLFRIALPFGEKGDGITSIDTKIAGYRSMLDLEKNTPPKTDHGDAVKTLLGLSERACTTKDNIDLILAEEKTIDPSNRIEKLKTLGNRVSTQQFVI